MQSLTEKGLASPSDETAWRKAKTPERHILFFPQPIARHYVVLRKFSMVLSLETTRHLSAFDFAHSKRVETEVAGSKQPLQRHCYKSSTSACSPSERLSSSFRVWSLQTLDTPNRAHEQV